MLDPQNLSDTVDQLQGSGILFCIEFVGSVIVKKSINSLAVDRHADFARDCMRYVIKKTINSLDSEEDEANNESIKYLNLPLQSYKHDVELNISSSAFIIIDSSTMRPLHRFDIKDISLFSPGFDEFSTYFCFFAKDHSVGQPTLRRCFVFNAQEEMEDVRDAIYFAFRLNEINKNNEDIKIHSRKSSEDSRESRTPIPSSTPPTPIFNEQNFFGTNDSNGNNLNHSPPDLPPRRSRLSTSDASKLTAQARERSGSNFIGDSSSFRLSVERLEELSDDLINQTWFHGTLTREKSDSLISQDGQFLVRTSPTNSNRFVLVGMQNGKVANICLLNNEGKLKSTAGEFKSIANFINYFYHSRKPVIVDEKSSPILLLHPVNRHKK